jgi:hypothetical protein
MCKSTVMATFAATVILAGFALSSPAHSCELKLIASLPITTTPTGRIAVPATIQDREILMLIDTAAIISFLAPSFVEELGLRARSIPGTYFVGFGGEKTKTFVNVSSFKLGNLLARNKDFLVRKAGSIEGNVVGLLGPDIMSHYDIEIDFMNSKFNMFLPNDCKRDVVYWTKGPFAAVPMRRAKDVYLKIRIKTSLDGRPLDAEIDTGSISFLRLETAQRLFRWNDSGDTPGLTKLDNGEYRYPFKVLAFEGVEVRNPDIALYPKDVIDMPGLDYLILGISVLRQTHLYIAYKDQTVYITPASAR